MASIKEIVTKAVIGKAKKSSTQNLEVYVDNNISNVLGCWIINNTFNGSRNSDKVNVKGSYDINIWYSYDNNTKTNVTVRNFTYDETIPVKLKNDDLLSNDNEVIIRSLTDPQVSDVKVEDNIIKLTVTKELGVEIVGDAKVRVNVEDDIDDYEDETAEKELEMDIDEDYLNGVNQN